MSNGGEYLGFLKRGDVPEKKEEVSETELQELQTKIERGDNLSNTELDKCTWRMIEIYLKRRGIKTW